MTEAWRRTAGGIVVEEAAARRITMVRLGRKSTDRRGELEAALGIGLPDQPNVGLEIAPRSIWMGPNEWMVVGTAAPTTEVERRLPDTTHLIVDVSDGRFVVTFSGRGVGDLLAKASSLDFHHRAFAPGSTAMTLFSQVPVVIDRQSDTEFELYFDVSHRAYVRAWIDDALTEFAYATATGTAAY